jgi:hypothetical protein
MLGNGRAAETFEYIFTLFGLITQPRDWLGGFRIYNAFGTIKDSVQEARLFWGYR